MFNVFLLFFIALLVLIIIFFFFFFSSRRRHTRYIGDWSSDVCSSDLIQERPEAVSRMSDEIGDGHFARENERHRSGEQPEEKKRPADHLDDAGEPDQRADRRRTAARQDRRREREPFG